MGVAQSLRSHFWASSRSNWTGVFQPDTYSPSLPLLCINFNTKNFLFIFHSITDHTQGASDQSSDFLMGIPAGVRLPKSSLVVVAVYVLCAAIHAVTKVFQRLRSLISYTLPLSSMNRSSLAPKGAWKTQPWSRMEGLCAVCQGEVGEGDEIKELRECLHSFHKDCLDDWVEEGHCTCPLCRSEF